MHKFTIGQTKSRADEALISVEHSLWCIIDGSEGGGGGLFLYILLIPSIGMTWSLFSDLVLNLAPSGLFGCSLNSSGPKFPHNAI